MYNFYKNMLLCAPMFYYGFWSGMSAITFYETNFNFEYYNTLYTNGPIIIYAIWDLEVGAEELIRAPYYYISGRLGQVFNKRKFWTWITWGWVCAFWIVLIQLYNNEGNTVHESGKMNHFYETGMAIYSLLVIIVNVRCYMLAFKIGNFILVIVILQIAFYFLIIWILSNVEVFFYIDDNVY